MDQKNLIMQGTTKHVNETVVMEPLYNFILVGEGAYVGEGIGSDK